jgi:hypothetical protein
VGKPVIGESSKLLISPSGSEGKMDSMNCVCESRRASKFSSTSDCVGTSKSIVKVFDGAGGGVGRG